MNKIVIYTPNEVDEAKKAIIVDKVDIRDYSQNIIKSNEFDDAIELSKNITDIGGDIELAIALDKVEYFQNLSKADASKEELWATLNIEYFADYTHNRWLRKDNVSDKMILQRVFKSGNMLYNRNSIARLWWVVKRTKDESLDDPYFYVRILLNRTQFEQSLLESSLSKSEDLLLKLMSAIVKFENNHRQISSPEIIKIVKRLNLLGGTYVLDIMDEEFYYNEILSVLEVEDKVQTTNIFTQEKKRLKNIFSKH